MMDKQTQTAMGIGVLAAAGIWWHLRSSSARAPQPSMVEEVAAPDYTLHPLRAWMSSGHMGPCHHYYATHVRANTNPEAIQLAEGTISVTGIFEAPDSQPLPSQLGARHG